ncbi:MAG: hypothetical protein IJO32_00530 [Bacilli bacterium]|nr:hypothetical protein [Bacilli bacterium]
MEEIFIEYEEYLNKFRDAQKEYNKVLTKKEQLYKLIYPQSSSIKDTPSNISTENNSKQQRFVELEEILIKQLNSSKSILGEREYLKKLKERELRNSTNTMDIVYVLRYLDRKKVSYIARNLGYSRDNVYKILTKIKTALQ